MSGKTGLFRFLTKNNTEQIIAKFLDSLIHGGEIIEHILCPYTQTHDRPIVIGSVVI